MESTKIPTLTAERADKITLTASQQLRTSRQYKVTRFTAIKESENLYLGVVKKTSIKNPFQDSFPFMSGFVDTIMSNLDDAPTAEITHNDIADYKSAVKYQALFDQESTSTQPNASWALKDRYVRKNALFSGVGVYSLFADTYEGKMKMYFNAVHYDDFHCEPSGGGDLENHLFCGEEFIYKTRQELLLGAEMGIYDRDQVQKILTTTSSSDHKEVTDEYQQRNNRQKAIGLDPETNNYIGQEVYRMVQFTLVFEGVRYYCLFQDKTNTWVRVKLLRDMYPLEQGCDEALYPYVGFQTHEDQTTFWSKAPCDDARPIATNINRAINQELYMREKSMMGMRAYDPEIFPDPEALADWRPDGLVPFDSRGGTLDIRQGLYEFKTGELSGTINLVEFFDSYAGQKTGTTPGSQGVAPANQKVGIFYAELKQIQGRMGLYNKSYKFAWEKITYRFVGLVDMYMTENIEVQIRGAKGVEFSMLTPEDRNRVRDFGIKIKGGQDEALEKQQSNSTKTEVLKLLKTVSPRWKDEQLMKTAGWTDEDIRKSRSSIPSASMELLSEAAMAVDQIALGHTPKLNQSANADFIQKLIDDSIELDDEPLQNKILDYAMAHKDIAIRNEARMLIAIEVEMKTKNAMDPNAQDTNKQPVPTNVTTPNPSAPPQEPNMQDMVTA